MKATAAGLQGKVDSSARAKEINVKWKQSGSKTGVGNPDVGDPADTGEKQKTSNRQTKRPNRYDDSTTSR